VAELTGLWAYAHVADVPRSIAFYSQLGLEARATHEVDGRTVWAFMTASEDTNVQSPGLMLAASDGTIDAGAQAVLFYCWTPDVQALRDELLAAGLKVGRVTHPFYMPAGEIRLDDPDGYTLLVGQLGDPAE
jgi:catechol 2,3-dioxygenase-like lactoylglutathione lyase family enzyme